MTCKKINIRTGRDHCFPSKRSLLWILVCDFFVFFLLLRDSLRGCKLLLSNSLKNAFSEGIRLEEKISMMPELICHAVLLSGKTGCYIKGRIIHLCADKTHLITHLLCSIACAFFYPSQDDCHWLPCQSLFLEYELQRQSTSYSSLSIFMSPVTSGTWQTLSVCFWLDKYTITLPLIFLISSDVTTFIATTMI